MSLAEKQKHLVYTQTKDFSFAVNPEEIFDAICDGGNRSNTILLESADIMTRVGEKSLMIASAALKATCLGQDVFLEALTENGKHALAFLARRLDLHIQEVTQTVVHLRFPLQNPNQNMEDRLHEVSALDVLRAMTNAFEISREVPPEYFLVPGIFAYDAVEQFEVLPKAKTDELQFPDFVFWLPETLLIIDHRLQKTHLIAHGFDESFNAGEVLEEIAAKITQFSKKAAHLDRVCLPNVEMNGSLEDFSDISDAEFVGMIEQMKERIVAGDVFQIVPSRSFKLPCSSPFAAYKQLRLLNPSPYMYYIRADDFTLLGASPETFIKVSAQGKTVEVRPIAGTRPRGFGSDGRIDPELDMRLEAELKLDEKELAEHFMLVDLARNDVARVSKPKTRRVSKLLYVDRYSHVMHLVSCVQGELKDNLDALHAYQASANMGTLVGAPKVKAMQILRETEKTKRGFYGGAVGYLDQSGNMDTAIVIRSALVKNNVAHVRAGAGIVFDSNPDCEVEESKNKAKAVLKAIALANAGSVK